jgi:type VI secretion system protein ImpH
VGPLGTLPLAYTELLLERLAEGDRNALDFLDRLHHAVLAPLYAAWAEAHPGVAYERWKNAERLGIDPAQVARLRAADVLTQALLDVAGCGEASLRPPGVRPETLAHYAGLFARQPRSAAALTALLGDYFAVPVDAIAFPGGDDPKTGAGDILFRLRLGPLDEGRYRAFLPGGDALQPLLLLTRWFVGPGPGYDVLLILGQRESPAGCILSETPRGSRLGWTSWLRDSDDPAEEDAVLIPAGQCREEERAARVGC